MAKLFEALRGADSPLPPLIPGYELLRRIGQGSYGEVWLARDATGEYRAVKVVYRKTFDHDRPYQRELSGIRKFEPVSRTHPSQVSILHVGQDPQDAYFYYVMELADAEPPRVPSSGFLVSGSTKKSAGPQPETRDSEPETPNRGQATGDRRQEAGDGDKQLDTRNTEPETYSPKTLRSEIQRRTRLPFAQCLEFGLALATALDHLHQNGLIHRDIKPSNVIFVNGVPKLADIGLVTDAGATISYVGTEGFLPPEGPGTPQADIYSLGKVLYEMSTGRDRLEFPELPTILGDSLEECGLLELNLIILKACQNDPARRYLSATEMAADLTLLRSGRSLKRAKLLEQRLANLTRAAVILVLAALVAGGSYYAVQQRRLARLRAQVKTEETEKQIFKTAGQKTLRQLVNACDANAAQLAEQRDYAGALLWTTRALREDHDDPARDKDHRRSIAQLLTRCPKVSLLLAHTGPINFFAVGSDGRYLLTASDDHTAQLWDATRGDAIGQPLKHPTAVLHAAFSTDSGRIVTASADGVAQVWDARSGTQVGPPLKHGGKILHVEFSPGGRQLLTVADQDAALIWEVAGGKVRHTIQHSARVLAALFSPDGRHVATASADGTARLWNTENADTPALPHGAPVEHLAFSFDSRRLATSSGLEARLWNTGSGEPAHFIIKLEGSIHDLAFSPDGRWIATASEDQTARLWDAVTGRPAGPVIPHNSGVQQLAFTPDGRWLLTASANRVQLWDPLTAKPAGPPLLHNDRVTQIQVSPNGDRILSASADRTARIQEVQGSPAFGAWSSRPIEELTSLAEFLSGRQIDSDGRVTAVRAEVLRHDWESLRRSDPVEFAARDLPAWHQEQADYFEKQGEWFAARFHLARALAANPRNTTLVTRRDRVSQKLETASAPAPALTTSIPARSATAATNLLDLSPFYNAGLRETWYPGNVIAGGNDLSALPQGVQKFGGIEFDVRGIVQLAGGALENLGGKFPRTAREIPVKLKCRRFHFLQGAGWSTLFGAHIGSYHITYADGETREVRLVFGQNIRDWWFTPPPQTTTGAAIAWEGSNAASRELGMAVRLYQMTWVNPRPEVEITSLDFISMMERSAPFLVAVTVD